MRRLSTILVVFGAAAAGWLSSALPALAADSILSDVLHRGSVRIAVTTGNEPRQFVDENGNLQGYDIDIANEFAKQLGVTAEFIRTDVAGRVAMLQSHKADITIATFTPTLDRLKTVAFTDPYTTDVLTLMTRADRKDLAAHRPISTSRRSRSRWAAARPPPRHWRNTSRRRRSSSLPGLADIIQAIDAGQVDATCSNDGLVNWTVKKSGGKYRAAAALGRARGRFDRAAAGRFRVVDVAQPVRPPDQRGRHQLPVLGAMVRDRPAVLCQTATENPLTLRRRSLKAAGRGVRFQLSGARCPTCRISRAGRCSPWN